MSTLTPNIGLTKPIGTENYDLDVVNTNSDIIDAEITDAKAGSNTRVFKVKNDVSSNDNALSVQGGDGRYSTIAQNNSKVSKTGDVITGNLRLNTTTTSPTNITLERNATQIGYFGTGSATTDEIIIVNNMSGSSVFTILPNGGGLKYQNAFVSLTGNGNALGGYTNELTDLASVNVNTVTKTGIYSILANCLNAPTTSSHTLSVWGRASTYTMQISSDNSTGILYTRTQLSGTWSEWRKIDTGGIGGSWHNVKSTRAVGIGYKNSRDKAILVVPSVDCSASASGHWAIKNASGATVCTGQIGSLGANTAVAWTGQIRVEAGYYFAVNMSSGTVYNLVSWFEFY